MNNIMYKDVDRVLVDEKSLRERIAEVGAKITADFEGEELIVVCILKGSTIFYADMVRELNLDVRFDFMSVSSYGKGMVSSGLVNIKKDLENHIDGKNVLIIEDIIDSGNTLYNLKNMLLKRNPKSLKICTLLDKPSRRVVDMQPDYCCFEIPDEFVIGYGLDYAEKYRNLRDVCVIKKEAI